MSHESSSDCSWGSRSKRRRWNAGRQHSWSAVMGDLELREVGVEAGTELGAVVGEHPGDGDAELGEFADHSAQEPFRDLGVGRADEHLTDRPAGRGVDRGELPDRTDTFEFADVEAVQGHQVTGPGREVTEPERSLERRLGQKSGGRAGELRERGDALTASTQPVTAQQLLGTAAADLEASLAELFGVAGRAQR